MKLNIEIPGLPWFRFEWHPEERCVYVIRKLREGVGNEDAELVCDGVLSPDQAKLAVHAFAAGYREHAREPALFNGRGPKHYRMFAEGGKIGAKVGDMK